MWCPPGYSTKPPELRGNALRFPTPIRSIRRPFSPGIISGAGKPITIQTISRGPVEVILDSGKVDPTLTAATWGQRTREGCLPGRTNCSWSFVISRKLNRKCFGYSAVSPLYTFLLILLIQSLKSVLCRNCWMFSIFILTNIMVFM